MVARSALAALLLAGCAAPAAAAPAACGARAQVLAHLADEYGEAPRALGIANNGGVLELLTAADGASWTVILTLPSGLACLIAAGEDWQAVPQLAQPKGEGS